jgi:DNA-binding CsgD family transcriptional regulator/tetratricopeptide (TPR) repeat protein
LSVASSRGGDPFLERADDLSVLMDALAGVRAGSEGRLVLVEGEAGVGKTALLRCFCDAQRGSVRVLWGACEPLLTPRVFGPLRYVAPATGGELEELVEGEARPHEVVAALLRELQSGAPTVLVFEDLHWADEATLDVLILLARRIGSVPALVLASFRDDELPRAEGLRVVVGELGGRVTRLKVAPLSVAAVAQLAEPYGVDGKELYRTTGGNAFFVTEVLGAGGSEMPATVRDAVLARVVRLPAEARRLLEAVALVPGHVELWLLDVVAGGLVDRLGECLGSGMLISEAGGVAFRHELARLAVEESISPDRRVALHRAALVALEAPPFGGPDLARLAHHAEGAGQVEGVLRWAPAAAERAASSGAHREAADQYARAIRFGQALSLPRLAELLQRRSDECYMTDQFEEAIDAQERALECHRQLGDPLGEGDSLRSLSRLLRFVGRMDEAEQRAREAVELLERLPAGHELAIAYCNVSHVCVNAEDGAGAVAWGTRALVLARRLDDTEAVVYALTNVGVAEFLAGIPAGQTKLERALSVAQRAGLEEHAGRAFLNLIYWPVRNRSYALATRYLEPALEYCTERGLDTWRLYALACRARLELDLGGWEEAADSAGVVLRDPRSVPVPRLWALAALGLVGARRGDAQATMLLDEAYALTRPTGELQRIAPVAAARAEAAWLAGRQAIVLQETDAALELALRREARWVIGELAFWRWRAGIKEALPPGAAEPYALSIRGEWTRAADLWRKLGCPYEAALALSDAAEEDSLRQALDELQALGARPAAAIVARRLRERGARGLPRGPRPRTRANPAGLTVREVEVLALVAEGLRNGEIAQRLVVAEKTVNHHVSAILRKLDASTRIEAVAAARRLGLTIPR